MAVGISVPTASVMRGIVFLLSVGVLTACSPGADTEKEAVREVIRTDRAPAAIGPYSQAIRHGNTLYLAGQVGLDPQTGTLVEGGVEAEARRAMENIGAVLDAAGFAFGDVTEVQVYLADITDFGAFNAVYASYFTDAPPARAVVEVAALPLHAQVEIKMTAVR